MPQSHFQFKQFTIEQGKCAMKVCTDACLFGAILSAEIQAERALDIGAGTGLLSCMFAQKNIFSKIDAVEIDEKAFEQAEENIANSIWKENICVHRQPVQAFAASATVKYDAIFSNPPFFENDLKSPDEQRNKALHSSALSLKELAAIANQLLAANGTFCMLIPFSRTEYFAGLAEKENLFLRKKFLVKQTPRHSYFRSILFLGRSRGPYSTEDVIIKMEDCNYSLKFAELLKDYYLYL